jgi:putative glutamine amidotransferase
MAAINPTRPIIGITADATAEKYLVGRSYAEMAARAGGVPVILPCLIECVDDYVRRCDAVILTGGGDPILTRWGVPMHPQAKPVDPDRQAFELALLDRLETQPQRPVLGICLGMQLMGLHGGGKLDQCLADTLPTAGQHWEQRAHQVTGELGCGIVHSHHRQALIDAGRLRVVAEAPDGVVEAIRDDERRFYLGVQWHPERTADSTLGLGLFGQLVDAAAGGDAQWGSGTY